MEGSTTGQECSVRFGDHRRQCAALAARGPAIRSQSIGPATGEPFLEARDVPQRIEEHLFVVAQEWDQPTTPGQSDELVQNAAGVQAAVDVVALCDDRISGTRLNPIDQRGARAAEQP